MKKLFLTTGILSVIVLFSGCSNPPQPPKAYKSTVSNSALEDEKKKEILNKSLHDVTVLAQKSAQISLNPSQNNCFVRDATSKPNAPFRGSMTSCYKIENNEITLKQEFKCFARDKAGNEKESNECSFGIVPHTERYVKFIDTVSQYVATAYNENIKAIDEAPKRAAEKQKEYEKTFNEIKTKSYAELEGQTVNIIDKDNFGHKRVEKTCKVQAKYNAAIAINKYEPIELYKKEFSSRKISFNDEIKDETPQKPHITKPAMMMAKKGMIEGKIQALVSMGKIPHVFNIEVASKTGSYSMSASENAFNVMLNMSNYLMSGTKSTNINRMLLLDAFLISTGNYEPTLGPNCTIHPSDEKDIDFLVLLKNKNPKALRLYGVIRNKDHDATDAFLLKNREVAEIFEKIKKIVTEN